MKRIIHVFTMILFILTFCIHSTSAQNLVKIAESVVTTNAFSQVMDGAYYMNGLSYQQDAIITHLNWQYTVFYNSDRHVTIARRKLPGINWELLTLTDYEQTTNDSHNTISIGIAPSDGTIHLSFDHHGSTLHYRKSIPFLATNPDSFSWVDTLFDQTTSQLANGNIVSNVTYPRFVITPSGDLQFEARIGTSGDGESYLWEYSGTTGKWTSLGKFVDNPNGGNAYLNGLTYDKSGRLHTTWVKRETPDASTNHDLSYIYSDDSGRTWHNNAGDSIGTTGTDPVIIQEPLVWDIPINSKLINQEAQTVDHEGRVHVFQRKNDGVLNYQFHYWRDLDGTWHETNTKLRTGIWYQRSKIAVDENNNLYALMPKLIIASATAASEWTDWSIINLEDHNRFHSEPLYDWYRLHQGDSILSVVYQEANSGNIVVMDYQLGIPNAIEKDNLQATNFSLEQNFPNPFNPSTVIKYQVPVNTEIELTVYDASGRKIKNLVSSYQKTGVYSVEWNAENLASGVYYYRLRTSSGFNQTRKMVLLK